jgi:hypothetical protein
VVVVVVTSRERQLEELLQALCNVIDRHQTRAANTIFDLREIPDYVKLRARIRRVLAQERPS